ATPASPPAVTDGRLNPTGPDAPVADSPASRFSSRTALRLTRSTSAPGSQPPVTRRAALTKEINELGGDVTETADGLHIRPRRLHGGVFHTYDDHRMATAGAVLGLAVEGVQIENVATTAKTLPDFPDLWTGMLGA
ncbi:hypothetical protein ACN6LI_000393, partial [Streptomyces violaceoruber]